MDEKLTEWNVNDYLKTAEERAQFIEAAIEEAVSENDPGIFSDALVSVVKSLGGTSDRVSTVMMAVSAGIDMTQAFIGDKNHTTRRAVTPRSHAKNHTRA